MPRRAPVVLFPEVVVPGQETGEVRGCGVDAFQFSERRVRGEGRGQRLRARGTNVIVIKATGTMPRKKEKKVTVFN